MQEKVWRIGNKDLHKTDFIADNHSGFSIVVPAWKIAETLDRKEFMDDRAAIENATRVEDMAKPHTLNDEDMSVFTRDTFKRDLEKASRKISLPEKETKETSE